MPGIAVALHLNRRLWQFTARGLEAYPLAQVRLRFRGSDATLVQSRLCLTVSIFRSARASGDQALARTPWQRATRTPMISLDRLVYRAYGAQALNRRLFEDSPLATSMPATSATEVQPQDHRNALDSNVLQKTPALAMAEAQTCHRSRKCTKVASEPI